MNTTEQNNSNVHNSSKQEIKRKLEIESVSAFEHAGIAVNSFVKTILLLLSLGAISFSLILFSATELFNEKVEKTVDNVPAHS